MRWVSLIYISLISLFGSKYDAIDVEVGCTCDTNRDRTALINLYNSTNGNNWINAWNLNLSMDSWYGVTLNSEGCVKELILENQNLSGTIPREIGNLLELERFWILGNQDIQGNIPTEIGQLVKLNDLVLERNGLSGSIPKSIENLTRLNRLSLAFNKLGGDLPSELGQLTLLEFLYLNGNDFRGEIPVNLASLTNLQELELSNNNLEGTIPLFLGDFASLTELLLDRNRFRGAIPNSLSQLGNLSWITLNDNLLSGCFPDELLIHCDITYNFINNTGLPWNGDFRRFCNGETQIGITCNDGDENTELDQIQVDCSCRGTNLCLGVQNNITIDTICEGQTRTFFGNTYDSTNTYFVSQTNSNGCTYNEILELTVLAIGSNCNDNNPATDNDMITADCECRGTIPCENVTVSISRDICEGEEVQVGNSTYTQTGESTNFIRLPNGCDSIVNLNLTVFPRQNNTTTDTICEGQNSYFFRKYLRLN